MSKLNGVNLIGHINKQFGLGEGARCTVRALDAVDFPFVLHDFCQGIATDVQEEKTVQHTFSEENPHPINLIHVNAENFSHLMECKGLPFFNKKYNIGFWAWELENFPVHFQNYIDMLDEIWVPSNFCLNAISQVSSKPVLRFMHAVEVAPTDASRKTLNLPEDKLIFLVMFDYHSSVQRKNPYAAIEAFEQAFGKNNSEVCLVVKSSASAHFPTESAALKQRIADNSSIMLVDEILPRKKLEALMASCDVYVSLHRSEGFGLTMAEAMSLGKPVIATAYSANTEFMTAENSFLIPYTMIPAADDYEIPGLENSWADADISAAAAAMLLLKKDPDLRAEVGEKAKLHVQTALAPLTIGERIKSRLDYIYSKVLPILTNNNQQIISNLKYKNEVLTKKNSALKKIDVVRLKLAFKNFKNRLSGKNRKYIWED
ncbi:glycosyltransferase family 4 protein [Sphingobacterium oryzagri]|uniref:Glycosyltransferase family 4 protein n=1 Tax=Sphingobacterium oryzagri TaxID=3025669 RepID=A0ABY7WJ26_9SPHI|nr:glycosyltransferase family 4 protein [Sphingobacterium sp. KACC 22765]WDF69515.1 glycosyltransferase family 4 protein [Sphingobacterium sp. KACC 22765]